MHQCSSLLEKTHLNELAIYKASVTPFHDACIEGDIDYVEEELKSSDCNVNKRGRLDEHTICTPLSFACQNDHITIVKLLLQAKGINANKSDYFNNHGTPLHVTSRPDIAQLLIDHDADINAPTVLQRTPLITHILENNAAIVSILIDARARVEQKDMFNHDALFYAFSTKDYLAGPVMIRKLLDAGANPIDAAHGLTETAIEKHSYNYLPVLCNYLPMLAQEYHFYIFPYPDLDYVSYTPISLLKHNAALLKYLNKQVIKADHIPVLSQRSKENKLKAFAILQTMFDALIGDKAPDNHHGKRAVCLQNYLFLYNATTEDVEQLFGEKSIAYAQKLLIEATEAVGK